MCTTKKITHNITSTIDVGGAQTVKLKGETRLEGKEIVGLFVRRQNAAGDKISCDGNPLIANDALNGAFLMLKLEGVDTIYEYPLEHAAFDSQYHAPGSYAPIHLPNSFDIQQSTIKFKGAAPAANTDLEIVFLTNGPCIR